MKINKKFLAVISAALIICLCIPTVPVLADAYLIPGIVTTDSLSGYSFNFPDADAWSGYIPGVEGLEGQGYKFSHFYDQELAFPVTNSTFDSRNFGAALSKLSDLNIDLENYYYAICTTYNANLYVASLFLIPKSGGYFDGADVFGTYNTFSGSGPGGGTSGFCVYNPDIPSDVTSLPITYYNITLNGSIWGNWQLQSSTLGRTFVNNSNNVFFFSFNSIGNIYNLLYSNMDFILLPYVQWDNVFRDANNNVIIPTVTYRDFCTYYISEGRYQKGTTGWFNLSQAPYYNGTDVITPSSGEESNANHMYFNSCDFGFCEPLNVNSFSNFGGAYFYCNYSVDSWVRDHINDYSIVFSAVATIGSRQYNGTVVSKLDPDMCLTLPFNAVFSNFTNLGFSSYVTNKKVDGNYLKTYLYSVDPNNYLGFYNSVSSGSSGNSLSDALNKLIQSDGNSTGVLVYSSDSLSQVIKQNVLTTEFLNTIYFNNNYKFRVQAYLIDNDGNESGAVARLFDIVKGSSISVDNQGLTNEDPFESDDDTGEQLPSIPDNTGTSVGYSTNGGIVNNINIPSEYSVTYRDGVNTFIDWFNKDPEVTGIQNSFWGALGVFKGNPANELYSDYFGFLPDGFKSIIFGCAGIGIIGAAATILRKRLMK